MKRYRVHLAFLVAPIAAVTALSALMAAASNESPSVGFVINALPFAYLVEFLLGVPAYLLTRAWNLCPPYGHALVGALIGLLPAYVLSHFTSHFSFVAEIVVASSIAGLVFGLIAGRNLTIAGGVRDAL